MSDLVSVIIADLFEEHLPETIENLKKTADGPIEIIVKKDDQSKGMRYCLNQAVEEAQGEFLFKIDGHCIMTPHWDTILQTVCADPKDMAITRIKSIDEDSWTVVEEKQGFDFVTLETDLSVRGCGEFVSDDPDTAETMATTGCGIMLHRQRYLELGRCWEHLGRYGNLGAEWALKIWLSGGKMLVNRYVTCGHLFRIQGVAGCTIVEQRKYRKILGLQFALGMGPEQKYKMAWLAERFGKIGTEKVNNV